MVTVGQKITEFITRGETYISEKFLLISRNRDSGEEYESTLFKMEGLYMFLVELQGLYNQWTDREILQFIDYWDNECDLKVLQGIIPDPYRNYENQTVIVRQGDTLVVPGGVGFIFRAVDGTLSIIPATSTLTIDYGFD